MRGNVPFCNGEIKICFGCRHIVLNFIILFYKNIFCEIMKWPSHSCWVVQERCFHVDRQYEAVHILSEV